MNETTLNHFRHLAEGLASRERVGYTVTLANGKEVKALYDPLFKAFTMGGMTFPVGELATWAKLCWGAQSVEMQTEEASNEATTL
jgi:hypothetical protein